MEGFYFQGDLMLRYLLVLIFLFQGLIYAAENPFKEYKTDILSINNNYAFIEDNDNIVVGSSGIVTHSFDNETSSIIARVSVVSKDGKKAKVQFEVFDLLEQAAFPIPGITPRVGDMVTLNYLYDRALIVAPNETVYNEVTKHFDGIEWIHPDLMAAYLAVDYKPAPSRSSFDILCRKNTAGLIFFALDQRGFFADCQSLKVLKTIKSGRIANYQLPFYNRLDNIDTIFWKWSNKRMRNYNYHYARLLGL